MNLDRSSAQNISTGSHLPAIRPMDATDVQQVVDIHMQAFQSFFLTFLGFRFLHELYSAILNDPSGITLVFENENGLAGFVAGTDQPAGFYSRLLKQRWWRFGLASIIPALRQPGIVPRLLRAFRKSEEARTAEGCGTLMSIAVSPHVQSHGVGQALVRSFLDEARQRGLSSVNLTTDQENNEKANQFYQKLGFVCARSFATPEGRQMNEYLIKLP